MATIENIEHCDDPEIVPSIKEDTIVVIRCVRLESVFMKRGLTSMRVKAFDHSYFEVIEVIMFSLAYIYLKVE